MKQILFVLFFSVPVFGFAQFTGEGKITFERRTNMKLQYQTEEQYKWAKDMIDEMAPVKVAEFSMIFNGQASLYQFEENKKVTGYDFSFGSAGKENKVYMNFQKKTVVSQKQVYERNYLVTDSIRHFRWKIEDEMRTIDGYLCRKALTTICDSVVVVAFYTDQITVSGGPEGFNGLPGMIMELAIPRLYTIWIATNVEFLPEPVITPFKHKRKSIEMNRKEFLEDLRKSMKSWGDYATEVLWWANL